MMKKNAWFTLIELMVVMSMFAIMVAVTYIPYSYYEVKQRVKIWGKQVSQILYEARNMAINGQSDNNKNVSVGVVFDIENEKNKVILLTYPYTFTGSEIGALETSEIKKIRTLDLPKWVQLEDVWGKKKALFFFQSISGQGKFWWWDTTGVKSEFPAGDIEVKLSFKWSTETNLQKIIHYYTYTHIIDY